MRFVALFEDRPDGGAVRDANAEAHEAFLRRHKGTILLAGALREQQGGRPVGGLWLFEAESREAVDAIIAEDPFFTEGLRRSIRVLSWGTAPGFEDMAVVSNTHTG